MIKDEKISQYVKNNSVVKVEYLSEEWTGQVLRDSKNFLLLHEIRDYAYDGFVIFNKNFITKIERKKYEKFTQSLMEKCAKKPEQSLKWLNLKSFDTLLNSLQKNHNKFCVDTTDDENNFFVGKIIKYNDETISIKALDTFANFEDKLVLVNAKDIGYILFSDSYSKMLFKYNKEINSKN